MLFEPARHEPLQDIDWDTTRARAAIADIVEDMEATLGAEYPWPWHPLDAGTKPGPPPKSIYLGASGMLWALWYLEQAGAVSLRVKPPGLIDRLYESYLAVPDTGEVVPSYFLGEVGILLIQWRLTGSRAAAERMYEAIARNIPNPTNEALWAAPGTDLDEMLVKAGNAVWNAGPLTKGPGVCHGTAGNGYAFLKLHLRTGDPVWLVRARSFAMHAIAQSERALQQHGRRRYSLWTGDPGLAVYLWHCLTCSGGLPALDILD